QRGGGGQRQLHRRRRPLQDRDDADRRTEPVVNSELQFPSWPGIAVGRTASLPLAYARPSTSSFARRKDMDARHKAGHDESPSNIQLLVASENALLVEGDAALA